MPSFKFGDIWEAWGTPKSLFVASTNAMVNSKGKLVMGRGIARQLAERCPTIPALAAKLRQKKGKRYGFLSVGQHDNQEIGLFQVKYHWREPANLLLIQYSIACMMNFIENKPIETINMNFPGIGNGHRAISEIEPLLGTLPDNVFIWRFANENKPNKDQIDE